MGFEWDDTKNDRNFEKHGIRFEFAVEVFHGPHLVKRDTRRDYGEERLCALGFLGSVVVFVVFTMRGENVRLISVRKANETERKVLYGYLKRGTIEDPWFDQGE